MELFYDVETTGLFLRGERSDHPDQPHLVQIAALLDDGADNIVAQMDRIVRPNGWIIPSDSIAIHGITNEQAMDEGIPENEALDEFMAIAEQASERIAHNEYFDMKLVRIAHRRYRDEAEADRWKGMHPASDTYRMAQRSKRFRHHQLGDVHRQLFGCDIDHAHKAMADVLACRRVYRELRAILGQLPLPDKPAAFTPAQFA